MPARPNLIAPRATLSSGSQIAWAPDPARDPSHFINRIIRTRAARLNLIAVRAATPSCSRGRSHFTCDGAGELSDSAGRLDDAGQAELAARPPNCPNVAMLSRIRSGLAAVAFTETRAAHSSRMLWLTASIISIVVTLLLTVNAANSRLSQIELMSRGMPCDRR